MSKTCLDVGLPGPDESQHLPHSQHRVQHPELESCRPQRKHIIKRVISTIYYWVNKKNKKNMHTRDKKLYGLQNIGGLLGAKELSHHRQA
jgi:hypothetical protein